jgi:hypothetical protein
MITQSELKELLHYDKDTGVFTWLVAKGGRVKPGQVAGAITTSKAGKSYILIQISGKKYMAHRVACLYVYGTFPENEMDHIDGQGMNNKWVNQ